MFRWLYDRTIRPYLPPKIVVCNVRKNALFDRKDVFPDFKTGLIDPIRKYTEDGWRIVEIGSGYGRATTVAARQTDGGRVVAYEGSHRMAEHTRETLSMNKQTDNVEIVESAVGNPNDVWSADFDVVSPEHLPDHDLLIMDCEGSEVSIIRNLKSRPNLIISEVHGQKGVSVEEFYSLLRNKGYRIERDTSLGPAEGHRVVTAVR